MLDLDSLAEKCARGLNESQDGWLSVVWSAEFQRLAKDMSDGEVEALLRACRSLAALQSVLGFLRTRVGTGSGSGAAASGSPFALVEAEARAAGLGLSDWISSLVGKI